MTLWTSVLMLVLVALTKHTQGQNLFDAEHTKAYATYLFQAGEFELATEELERLVFLQPNDEEARLKLVQAYRKAGDNRTAIYRLEQFMPIDSGLAADFALEKGRLLILNGQLNTARMFLGNDALLDQRQRLTLQVTTELLDSEWQRAESLMAQSTLRGKSPELLELSALTQEAITMKRKSPALSVALSTIVPGLGKAYSGAWKDGAVSLVFISLTAWQAYQGFSKHGSRSAYGWTFASISGAFYLGNLYGSAKAAKKHNSNRIHSIHHRVESHFNRLL